MTPKTVYPLPRLVYRSLAEHEETRPAALITSAQDWQQVGGTLELPVVVQAEPDRMDDDFIAFLADNVPSMVQVLYVVGAENLIQIGKLVAHQRGLPVVLVPTALDSDQLLEAHVELIHGDILSTVDTGPAEQVIIDWDVIQAAEPHRRAAIIADLLAVVTGLLDWRHATKLKRTTADHAFVPWAAGISASLASQAIKLAEPVGQGDPAALRTLLDLASVSVQLANQLGHARQQEGSEHYFAFALEKLGVDASHAECLGPGILLTSALHNQDPSALRDALSQAGIRLDRLRPADVQLAINDLQSFVLANDLPYGVAHEIDPFADSTLQALHMAGLSDDTGGWVVGDTDGMAAQQAALQQGEQYQQTQQGGAYQQAPTQQNAPYQDQSGQYQQPAPQQGGQYQQPPQQGEQYRQAAPQQPQNPAPDTSGGGMPPQQPPS